jgi:hypothetical protein
MSSAAQACQLLLLTKWYACAALVMPYECCRAVDLHFDREADLVGDGLDFSRGQLAHAVCEADKE